MKKSITFYLVVSFVAIMLIGVAIGYTLGRSTDDSADPVTSGQSNVSRANDLPASTDKPITKEGTIGCLKAKGNSPQTMDCATGLTTADSTQYALGSEDPTLTGSIPTGTTVRVTGTLSEPTNTDKYDTAGTIHVTTITKL